MLLPVYFNDLKVAEIIDTGSLINVISKKFHSESHKCKNFHLHNSNVILANNVVIPVLGTATLNLNIECQGEPLMYIY